jgi:(p)ppGpp synthase/HD superfamily hydrolase
MNQEVLLSFALIDRAFLLASRLHRSQIRRQSVVAGAPYLSHLMEVAGMVSACGGPEEACAAALLHDALEDVSSDAAKEIETICGPTVLRLVKECTEIGVGNGGVFMAPWKERKKDYIARVQTLSPSALLISVADKLHNSRELKRAVRMQQSDAPYNVFATQLPTLAERKQAVLWYDQGLVAAYATRLETLAGEPLLPGIRALLNDFKEIVDWLARH